MKEIIDLRLSIEELEDLPLYKWKELLRERKESVRKQLKLIQGASEYLKLATAEDLRKRALDYKRVVEDRVKRDEQVRYWMRHNNQSEEGREKERLTTSKEEKEAEEKKRKERIEKDIIRPPSV